jgi:hypothetical protein
MVFAVAPRSAESTICGVPNSQTRRTKRYWNLRLPLGVYLSSDQFNEALEAQIKYFKQAKVSRSTTSMKHAKKCSYSVFVTAHAYYSARYS